MIAKIITGDLGVNTYLYNYNEQNALLIDPGSDAEKIIRTIDDNKCKIRGIVLTHGHFDHIGAVKELKDRYNTKVYIHKDDAGFLGREGEARHKEMFSSMGPGGSAYFNQYYSENDAADVLLIDNQELQEFGLTILHTPGHSPGSICLYSKENSILFSGDTMFKGGLGRTDFTGGDYRTLMNSLDRLLLLPGQTMVYPGHGYETTISEEKLSR